MKKILIATVAIAFGLMANAASFQWRTGTQAIYDGYKSGKSEYSAAAVSSLAVYLINNSTYAQSTLVTALSAATDATGIVAAFNAAKAKQISSGTTATTGRISSYVGFTQDVAAGDSLTAYLIALVQDGDDAYVYVSDTVSGTAQATATTSLAFTTTNSSKTLASGGSGWYAVPEPTSGMLMLLGMAGLALKRKRA